MQAVNLPGHVENHPNQQRKVGAPDRVIVVRVTKPVSFNCQVN